MKLLSKILWSALLLCGLCVGLSAQEYSYSFMVANDLGRNGYYLQKPIAEAMGESAKKYDVEFVAAAGDVHHFLGVRSVNDPLWLTNFEQIYAHPELMIDWKAICGNHEYRGSTQAILDYSKVSRRWSAPARYYTEVVKVDDKTQARLLFIDTTPLISKYQKESADYPDVKREDPAVQLQWIDSVLKSSKEKWTIVIGHHPVYAQTKKSASEREDLQRSLEPMFAKYGVDCYFAGHIHSFQHITSKRSQTHYFVNSSASLARPVEPIEGTRFCSPAEGFSICQLSSGELMVRFLDWKGSEIYNYSIKK